MLTLPPLTLYVHIPWCVRKCPYCDFNSHAHDPEKIPEDAYVTALLRDLEQDLEYVQGRKLDAIFFGGGTPSLFSGAAIRTIIRGIQDRISLVEDVEITLEANPGVVDYEKFSAYFDAGINRLSLGVQSFNAEHLHRLGRIHNPADARNAIQALKHAGFDNFNIDLMHGLPGQTSGQACQDLRQAFALEPSHISWYELTIEQNTAFYNDPPALPDEDMLAEIQDTGLSLLARHGYQRYEISAYAKPGMQCKHNLNYWRFGDYLGIGAGSHAKVTLPQADRIIRLNKTRHPEHYLSRTSGYQSGDRIIKPDELPLEYMMNRFRLYEPFTLKDFEQASGLAGSHILPTLQKQASKGLIHLEGERIEVTETGHRYLNNLLDDYNAA